MDLSYLGLVPKGVIKVMLKYEQGIKKKGDNELVKGCFQQGRRQLLASIILRTTVSTQKVMSFLLKDEVNKIR